MAETLRFKIGDAFPAEDSVARFITVLGMASNDWMRSIRVMSEIEDGDWDSEGWRVLLFREQAARYHEAAAFLRDTPPRFPEVAEFLDGLPKEAQQEREQIVGGINPQSSQFLGQWIADHRNVTFHYAEMHPAKAEHGKEEITLALHQAAEIEGTISMQDDFGSVRFGFADQVAVQWLPDMEEKKELIVGLREAVMALARFVQRAAQAYLDTRPSGVVIRED